MAVLTRQTKIDHMFFRGSDVLVATIDYRLSTIDYRGRDTTPTQPIYCRANTTVVIKGVPADVCETCGEYYLSEEMTDRVLAMTEEAVAHGTEVKVL